METAPPTFPDRVPAGRERVDGTPPKADGATTSLPHVSGFLRLKVDQRKKATGCFLLFADGQVLTGTVEGVATRSAPSTVGASLRLHHGTARQLDVSRPNPADGRRLLFQACDH